MDLNSYLRIFRRRWSLVLLTVVVGVVAAVVATPANSADAVDYTATHRLLLQPVKTASGETVTPNNDTVTTLEALLSSRDVEQRAAADLGFTGDPAALGRRVGTVTTSGELTIAVTATDPDRAQAAALADAFANALIKLLEERAQEQQRTIMERAQARMNELQVELRQLDQRIGTNVAGNSGLVAQRAALAVEYQRQHQNLEVAEASRNQSGLSSLGTATARKAGGFVAPRSRAGRGLVAAGLGLPIGLALALVVERVDRRIRTKEMAEKAFGLPVLAEVPPMKLSARRHDQVVTAEQPSSMVAEAYRNLRTSLTLMATPRGAAPAEGSDQSPVHVILVSSANPGEGKTTTATNLAAAYAEAGEQVLVLDCDFRHPRVGTYLGVEDGPGLSDALGATRSTRLADVVVASQVPGVNVVTSGTPVPNPAELFARGHHVLQEATRLADVVIFDTPPMLVINDASELLPLVDTVVLTCRSGRTTVEAAERTGELLTRLGGPVAGVVLVGSTEAPSSRGHYYYYGGNTQDLPFWRRLGAARGPRGRPPARGGRPPATAPRPKSQPKGKAVKNDRRPRPPEQPRPKRSAPPGPPQQAPRQAPPAPNLAEPSRPRPAAPPAAQVGPLPSEPPSPPRQERPAPQPRPEVFAPPAAPTGGGRAQPDPTDVAPDPIALTDPDQTSVDAATPEDVSPSVTPPSPR